MSLPVTCVVSSCGHKADHYFPSDPKYLHLWLKASRLDEKVRTGWKLKKCSGICSEHFIPSDYDIRSTFTQKELGRRNTVSVVFVSGSHYDVGFDVGRTFGSMIQNFLAINENVKKFEKEYETEYGKTAYQKTLDKLNGRYPFYVKELQGVADGAKVPFRQLFLLHMDDVIDTINDNQLFRNDTGGCTSIGVNTAHTTVLGHTEDALSETLNHFYIVSAHVIPTHEDKNNGAVEERFASVCYAGQLPGYTSGYNEHGLVFSINTLSPRALKPGATPRTFITRAMLAAQTRAEVEAVLLDEGVGIANGFSLNMLWTLATGERQMFNVEVAPNFEGDKSLVNVHKYGEEVLIHCNKYQRLLVAEVKGDIIDSSNARLKTISQHKPAKTRKNVEDIISDNSSTLYQVFATNPDSAIITIVAGIFDLERMTWSLYIQKPNASEPVAVLPIHFNKLH